MHFYLPRGLATAVALGQKGHQVTVLESTAKLQTIGGGISVPPNSMRVMHYFGIDEKVKKAGEVQGETVSSIRRYDGDLICDTSARSRSYKYEHINIHRAPLQKVLAEAAMESGVEILVDARVIGIDENGEPPVAVTKDGRKFEADLIIGADGAKLERTSRALGNLYKDQFSR